MDRRSLLRKKMSFKDKNQETWGEALLLAIAVLWFIAGAVIPAPIMPLALAPDHGWPMAILFAVIATLIWLGVPYMLYKKAENIRKKRQEEKYHG